MLLIAEQDELKKLVLANARVSDHGIASLFRLRKMEYLDLSGTEITDAAIAVMKTMPNLKVLNVSGTKISQSGEMSLKKHLPNCRFGY